MRISCILGPYLPVPPVRGGAVERVWQNLCSEFSRAGHDVTLISRRFGDMPKEEICEGVVYRRIPSIDAPRSKLLYRAFDVAYAAMACSVLRPSDITITNSVSLPLLIPRSRAGKIYVNVNRFPKGQMGFYWRADRLQAVSQAVADAIRRQSPAMSSRVRVIPNALSATFRANRSDLRGTRLPEILYVGRIAREKGLELLIRGFLQIANCENWRLTILGPAESGAGGDGNDYLDSLRKLSREGADRVRFEPPIFDEAALVARLRVSEIFVYPSIAEFGESFGMAPLEAMTCGCAVVVSGLACFNDFAVNGENALVFDQKDASGVSLANALRMLMNDESLRDRLASSAIRASEKFDAEPVAGQFLEDFTSLLTARSDYS